MTDKCCCNWGASVGKRYGFKSLEWPEFDCADCLMHGDNSHNYRCKRHRRIAND